MQPLHRCRVGAVAIASSGEDRDEEPAGVRDLALAVEQAVGRRDSRVRQFVVRVRPSTADSRSGATTGHLCRARRRRSGGQAPAAGPSAAARLAALVSGTRCHGVAPPQDVPRRPLHLAGHPLVGGTAASARMPETPLRPVDEMAGEHGYASRRSPGVASRRRSSAPAGAGSRRFLRTSPPPPARRAPGFQEIGGVPGGGEHGDGIVTAEGGEQEPGPVAAGRAGSGGQPLVQVRARCGNGPLGPRRGGGQLPQRQRSPGALGDDLVDRCAGSPGSCADQPRGVAAAKGAIPSCASPAGGR